jgi:hypothetical protein
MVGQSQVTLRLILLTWIHAVSPSAHFGIRQGKTASIGRHENNRVERVLKRIRQEATITCSAKRFNLKDLPSDSHLLGDVPIILEGIPESWGPKTKAKFTVPSMIQNYGDEKVMLRGSSNWKDGKGIDIGENLENYIRHTMLRKHKLHPAHESLLAFDQGILVRSMLVCSCARASHRR